MDKTQPEWSTRCTFPSPRRARTQIGKFAFTAVVSVPTGGMSGGHIRHGVDAAFDDTSGKLRLRGKFAACRGLGWRGKRGIMVFMCRDGLKHTPEFGIVGGAV